MCQIYCTFFQTQILKANVYLSDFPSLIYLQNEIGMRFRLICKFPNETLCFLTQLIIFETHVNNLKIGHMHVTTTHVFKRN